MNSFPEIKTDRLTLRRIEISDLIDLVYQANNEKIADQIFNINYPYTEADAVFRMNVVLQGFEQKNRFIFAITQVDEDKLIGEIGLNLDTDHHRAEMGYWIAEDYWGKGIATEACKAVLKFGFNELGLHKIFATHFKNNPASGKILNKIGMMQEAELKDHYLIEGEYRTAYQYRLTKKEYKDIQ